MHVAFGRVRRRIARLRTKDRTKTGQLRKSYTLCAIQSFIDIGSPAMMTRSWRFDRIPTKIGFDISLTMRTLSLKGFVWRFLVKDLLDM